MPHTITTFDEVMAQIRTVPIPPAPWDASDADILGDLRAAVRLAMEVPYRAD